MLLCSTGIYCDFVVHDATGMNRIRNGIGAGEQFTRAEF